MVAWLKPCPDERQRRELGGLISGEERQKQILRCASGRSKGFLRRRRKKALRLAWDDNADRSEKQNQFEVDRIIAPPFQNQQGWAIREFTR
jgi:hypothetical protein